MSVDAVLVNGTLLTQDATRPEAEALAISGGRIHAVGARKDIEPLAGPSTERIDLEGGTLLPGFNDSHVHVWKVGQLLTGILDLRSVRSLDELKAVLLRRDRELPPGTWLLGRGYNELLLSEGRQPTRQDLDQAALHRPVAVTRTCGHMLAANSRALALAGIDRNTPDPPGGVIVRDAGGDPTGVLQETAMGILRAVMPEPTPSEYEDMVRAGIDAQLTKGITSASEAGANPNLVSAYRALDHEGGLRHRMHVMAMRLSEQDGKPLPLPERWISSFLRLDSVKLFADGGLSGATAALKSPYRHDGGRGLLRLSEEEVYSHALDAQSEGFRVCTHAIGDAAIDVVLGAYERLQKLGGRGHRFEHFGLPDRRQIERAFRVGAIAAPQTGFLHSLGGNFRRYLTDDYLERCYPIRSMLRGGIIVALGSDAPVVPDDRPLLGVQAAVRRLTSEGDAIAPGEAIRVEEALSGYTLGGALASGDADNRGSLTAGKWADLVLLDENPCRVAAEEIAAIQVLATYVSGRRVYPA